MESYESEHLFLLALDSKNQLIKKILLTKGTKNASMFHQGEAVRHTLLLNANSVMLIHNHPSGISTPSSSDIETTRKLKESCDILGISLLDHIVFGHNEYTSIRNILEL